MKYLLQFQDNTIKFSKKNVEVAYYKFTLPSCIYEKQKYLFLIEY